MSEHKPKLVIVPANKNHGAYIEDAITGRSVCDFYVMKNDRVVPFHDAEANARVLVASFDMLEALEAIANGEGTYGAQAHEYKQIARAAISKATGGGE